MGQATPPNPSVRGETGDDHPTPFAFHPLFAFPLSHLTSPLLPLTEGWQGRAGRGLHRRNAISANPTITQKIFRMRRINATPKPNSGVKPNN